MWHDPEQATIWFLSSFCTVQSRQLFAEVITNDLLVYIVMVGSVAWP